MKFLKKILPLALIIASIFTLTACGITVTTEDGSNNPVYTTINVNTQLAPTTQSSLVEVLEEIRPSVVEIYASKTGSTSAGSGIVYSKSTDSENVTSYYILTCHHVIDGTTDMSVKDINGGTYKAKLIGGDPESDIAVLVLSTADGNNFDNAKLSVATLRAKEDDKDYVKVGEEVVAIGNPLGTLGGTVTRGIISSVDRPITVEGKQMTLIQTDCAINSGNSGGALFSTSGQLVGVVNAGYSGSVEGLNFAIPANYAMEIANDLLSSYHTDNGNYGYVTGRASITVADVTNVFWAVDTTGYDMFFATKTSGNSYYTSIAYVNEDTVYGQKLSAGMIVTAVSYEDDTLNVTTSSGLVNFISGLKLTAGKTLKFTVKSSTSSLTTETIEITVPQYIYKP